MFGGLDEIPNGVFAFFLNLWEKVRFAFIDIVAFLTEHTFDIVGYGSFNVLDFMLGLGLGTFIVVAIVRFVISIFTGG